MSTTNQTITFIFDNDTDQILLFQSAEDGPLKRKHFGIKGSIGITDDHHNAAIFSVKESSGIVLNQAVLRGVVKVIQEEAPSSIVYFVYESSRFSGELENHLQGRLKWMDILNIFNLPMEGFVQEIMPNLLDGESFFEGSIFINDQLEVLRSDIRICNAF